MRGERMPDRFSQENVCNRTQFEFFSNRGDKMKKIIVAEKIIEFRRKKQLTQGEFGNLLGVSAQAISKWERGVCYPDITVLPDLAEMLGCTVNDFFE